MALKRFDLRDGSHNAARGFLPPHGLCGRMRRFLVAGCLLWRSSANILHQRGHSALVATMTCLQLSPRRLAADAALVRAEPLRLGIGTRRHAVVPAVERANPHRVGCKRARPERSSRAREPSVATAVGGQRRHGGVGRHAAKALAATVGTMAADGGRRGCVGAPWPVGAAPASGGCAAPMKAEASPQRAVPRRGPTLIPVSVLPE